MAAASKDNQLRQIQEKIKALAESLSRLDKQKGHADSELKKVEQQYGKISRTVKELNTQVSLKQQRINAIQEEMQLQNGWLLTQQSHLAKQVRTAYALGRQEQLKLLFNQQDSTRSSRVMTYYRYFNQARINKLQRINASLQLLSTLEQEKQQEIQALEKLVADKKVLQTELEKSKRERQQLLVKIKEEYRQSNSELSRLKKNEQQLKQLISALEKVAKAQPVSEKTSQPFIKLKGKLPWPVAGKIARSYGSSRSGGRWNGVLISAKEGSKIKAIAHGQVIFSGWFKGYGLLVIIKHDNNFMSLYAFNQSLYREEGEWVNAGDIIATLGKSGGRDKAGLYFEIRKKDKTLNPAKWCQKKR